MTAELRDYVIAEGHLEEFVAAWLKGVVPLRERFGFRIEGAWTVLSESRFVWILAHDAPEHEGEALNDAYYASPERAALDPDPAHWVEESRQAFVQPILPTQH
ncbi:MAG: NIPSNAP family protein [Chloroflexi bacterium]|nr:NIPSNAP family protein [Chloroflexota bacterium]